MEFVVGWEELHMTEVPRASLKSMSPITMYIWGLKKKKKKDFPYLEKKSESRHFF